MVKGIDRGVLRELGKREREGWRLGEDEKVIFPQFYKYLHWYAFLF